MTPDQIERAASALVAARKGSAIASLPADAIPQTEADSYQIQDAVIAKLGEKIGGWKTGVLPTGGPFVAPIFASAVHTSPAALPASGLKIIGIECEIGFRVHTHFAHRANTVIEKPYTWEELRPFITMHPMIEVVDSRFQDFRSLDRLIVLADNVSNGGLVYGPAASDWGGVDLAHPPIEVTADGKYFADCTGLRAGNPIDLMVAAVNHAVRRCGGIPAVGTVITTGTHTGLVLTEPGTKIVADYGRLGRVEVSFPT